jgi:hypothetical protein
MHQLIADSKNKYLEQEKEFSDSLPSRKLDLYNKIKNLLTDEKVADLIGKAEAEGRKECMIFSHSVTGKHCIVEDCRKSDIDVREIIETFTPDNQDSILSQLSKKFLPPYQIEIRQAGSDFFVVHTELWVTWYSGWFGWW